MEPDKKEEELISKDTAKEDSVDIPKKKRSATKKKVDNKESPEQENKASEESTSIQEEKKTSDGDPITSVRFSHYIL